MQRRPTPGYLFDRFYNAWIESDSVETLEAFLEERADQSGSDGLLLAYFYSKQGDDLRAIERFRKTLAAEPGNAVAWKQKAVIEARMLDFETALADLGKAVEAGPEEELAAEIGKMRGRLLIRTGERERAIEAFGALLTTRPDDEELAEDVIELLVQEDQYDEAANVSERLIERTSDAYRKLLRRMRLGDIRHQAGDRKAAVAMYTQVLGDVGAGSWLEREVLAQLERVYRREEDTSGLKKEYERLAERYPRRIAVLRGHARVLADSGDSEAAIKKFAEVLAVTPGDRDNQQEFVRLHIRTGDFAGARKLLESLVELQPKDPELHVQIAEVAAKLEDPEGTAAAVGRYLGLSDKSEYAHLRSARLLDRLGVPGKAAEQYDELVSAFPDSVAAKEAAAAFFYKADKKERAIALWQEAAEGRDAQQVTRVARALAARQEHAAAYDLLKEKKSELARDRLFLAQFVDAALANKDLDEAVAAARRRVELADTTSELQAAVSQASRAIDRAKKTAEVLESLNDSPSEAPQLTCLRAELHDRNGDSQLADKTLAPLVKAGDPLGVSQQVRLARARGDWETAAAAAARMLELPDQRNSRNLRQLVELLERAFLIEEALGRIPEWKRLSPGSGSPWLAEARLLRVDGKSDEAIEVLREAVRRLDRARDVRSQLARFYTEAGRLADAERIYWSEYEEADDLISKVRAVEQLARISERQGKTASLTANFEERRRDRRTSIEPLMALAAIHRVTNDYAKRVQVLGEAAKLRPDDVQLLSQIAQVQEREGDWEAARDTLRRAIAADKTPKSKQRLARLLIRWGEQDEGYAMLRELILDDTDDPRELEKIADAMAGAGDWERASEFLRPLVARFDDDYRLHYLLGVSLEEEDRLDAAVDEFLAVLSIDRDNASVAANNAQNPMNWYQSELAQVAPPGFVELISATQQSYQAYAYRQQSGGGISISYGGAYGGHSAVHLPGGLRAAKSLAIAHLAELRTLVSEQAAADLTDSVAASGTPDAHAALLLSQGNQQGRQDLDLESLGDLVDQPNVLAYLAFAGRQFPSIGADLYQKAYDTLREEHPQVALIAALNGLQATTDEVEESHPLVVGALALIEQIGSPSSVTLMSASQVSGGLGQQRATPVPATLKTALGKWVVKTYPQASSHKQYGPWMMMQVAQLLRGGDDPVPYLEFLEGEITRHAGAKSKGQANFFSGGQSSLIAPPAFPPAELRGVPQSVVAIVAPNENSRQYGFGGEEGEPGWSEESFRKAVAAVKNPTLRLLLHHGLDDEEEVDSAIKELLDAEKPSLDAYLLAAGRAALREESREAIKLLNQARFLPMRREERQRIDGGLVALVQQVEEDKELLTIGREAALRLRHGKLQGQDRSLLASALTDFGLTKEAERLEKAGRRPSAAIRTFGAVTRAQPASQDQIERMIKAGRKEAAAKRLSQDIRAAVQQVAQNPWNRGYYAQQARERIDRYGLLDAALAQLDPGDSRAHRKHAEYAEALGLFQKHDGAIAAYEKALRFKPKEDAYRVKLMLIEARHGALDSAKRRIAEMGPKVGTLLASELQAIFQEHEMSFKQRFACAEIGVSVVEKLAEDERADITWASQLRQALAQQHYSNTDRFSLSHLYGTKAKPRKETKDLDKRRTDLHERLCRAMHRRPATCCEGFAGLAAAWGARGEADKKKAAELVELARTALLRHGPERGSAGRHGHVHYGSNGEVARLLSPAEHLVRLAASEGDWGLIEELQTALGTDGDRASRRAIEEFSELYRCQDNEFTELAGKLIRSWARRGAPPGADAQPEVVILECYRQRGLEVDVHPIFERYLADAVKQQSGSLPGGLLDYAEYLGEENGVAAATEWFEAIATKAIGPRERRAQSIKQHYQPNQWNWNSPNGRMHQLEQFLQQGAGRTALVLPLARFLGQAELGPLARDASQNLERRFQQAMPKEPSGVIDFLEDAGVLAEAADLPLGSIAGGEFGEGDSLVTKCLDPLSRLPKETRDQLRQSLQQREPRTLGVWVVLEQLAPEDEPPEVYRYAAEHREEVEALPERQRALVGRTLVGMLAPWKQRWESGKADPPEGAADTIAWVESLRDAGESSLRAKIAKLKKFEELGIEGHNLDDWFADTLRPMAKTDLDTAVDLYFRVSDLYDDAMRRGVSGYRFSRPTAVEMLRRMSWRWNNDDTTKLGFCKFAAAVVKRGVGEEKHSYDRNDTRQFFEAVPDKLRKLVREAGQKNPDKAIEKFYGWMDENFRDGPTELLSLACLDRLRNLPTERLRKASAWLGAEAESESSRSAALAADLRAVVGLAIERRSQRGSRANRPENVDAPHHAHFIELLDGDTTPVGMKSCIALMLCGDGQTAPSIGLSQAIARTAAEACDAGVVFNYGAETAFAGNACHLQRDAPGDEHAARFAQSWVKRFTRPPSRKRGSSSNPNQIRSTNSALALIALCLERGDAAAAKKLESRYRSMLTGRHELIALFAQHGLVDEAARLARAGWAKMPLRGSGNGYVSYDKRLEEAEPALLDKLDPSMGYVIRVGLARLSDAKRANEKASTPRKERMKAAAADYDPEVVRDTRMREAALCLFHEYEEASDLIGEQLGPIAEKIDLRALSQTPRFANANALKIQHATWKAKRGEPAPAMRLLEEYTTDVNGRHWNLRNEYQRRGGKLCKTVLAGLGKYESPDELRDIAETLRGVINRVDNQPHQEANSVIALLAASHVLADQVPEYLAWSKELEDRKRNWIRNRRLRDEDLLVFMAGLKPGDAATLDARIDRCAGMIRLGLDTLWLRLNPENRVYLNSRGLNEVTQVTSPFFTPAEAASALPRVPERSEEQRLLAWAIVGDGLDALGKHELAAEAWEDGYELAVKEDYAKRHLQLGGGWVRSLLDAGQTDRAIEVKNKVVSKTKPNAEFKRLYDGLTERIEKARRAAEPADPPSEEEPATPTEKDKAEKKEAEPAITQAA